MLSNFAEHADVFGELDAQGDKNSLSSGVTWPSVVSSQSDAPYLEALGLYINPFSVVSEEQFYFESPALKQRLQTLLHMVENNKALLCVTGDAGGGKTTLLRQFVALAKETWQPFEISVGAVSNERQILAKVASGINAPVCRYQFSGILSRVQFLNDENRFPVLVIDDAHELDSKVIFTLQKLKQKIIKKNLNMSIVLFAEQSIKVLLGDKLLRDLSNEWVYSIYLPRLSERDTANYIQHRMTVAGMLIDKPFKPADVKAIYKMAKGLPRKTNEVAHRMLACNFGDGNITRMVQLSWVQSLKNIVHGNWIYLAMGVSLLAMIVLVDPLGDKQIPDSELPETSQILLPALPSALPSDTDKIDHDPDLQIETQDGMLTSVNYIESDCDSTIFIDCQKGEGKIQKNIFYK